MVDEDRGMPFKRDDGMNALAGIYNRSPLMEYARNFAMVASPEWGVIANSQEAAKTLAVIFGNSKPPEWHGTGTHLHYHDRNRTFHIWFGAPID